MNPSEAKLPRPFGSNCPGSAPALPIIKIVAVRETWRRAAARIKKRRARRLERLNRFAVGEFDLIFR
jgi:hypothetical protein